jgi:hypothetical protein
MGSKKKGRKKIARMLEKSGAAIDRMPDGQLVQMIGGYYVGLALGIEIVPAVVAHDVLSRALGRGIDPEAIKDEIDRQLAELALSVAETVAGPPPRMDA